MPGTAEKLGRYEIIREIARSNDIVWEAYDPEMERIVAIKELRIPAQASAEHAEERLWRFKREARILARLTHPNIIAVYDVGEDGGRVYLVMELVEAPTLAQVLDSEGSLSAHKVGVLARQILSAAQYLHDQRVVHRDIKPQNMFLLPDGMVKLTDFGISKIESEMTSTQVGNILGTPYYIAPEQWLNKQASARSDIWAVGVVLFEACSGIRPFMAQSTPALSHAVCNLTPDYSLIADAHLRRVLERCLQKNPDRRFQSAAEMLVMLQQSQPLQQSPTPVNAPSGTAPRHSAPRPGAQSPIILTPRGQGAAPTPAPLPKAVPTPSPRSGSGTILAIVGFLVIASLFFFADNHNSATPQPPWNPGSTPAVHVSDPVAFPGVADRSTLPDVSQPPSTGPLPNADGGPRQPSSPAMRPMSSKQSGSSSTTGDTSTRPRPPRRTAVEHRESGGTSISRKGEPDAPPKTSTPIVQNLPVSDSSEQSPHNQPEDTPPPKIGSADSSQLAPPKGGG